PGEAAVLAPVVREQAPAGSARVAAPGPHDFPLRRRSLVWCKHLTPQGPSQPAPSFRDDAQRPLVRARAGRKIVPICVIVKGQFGKIVGWVERSETHQFISNIEAMG